MNSIKLQNVVIDFPLHNLNTRSLKKTLFYGLVGGRLSTPLNDVGTVRALDNISLHIEHGDRIGVIGHNGSGKSTLLRVLSGIYEPHFGHVQIKGKVTALLDIGFGMNSELSGIENVYFQGGLWGLTKQQINSNLDEIVEFSGLGEFISLPIHTYSSGMRLRLAFSIATCVRPEILILDEIIGVGDVEFQGKAKIRMDEMILHSGIVILASHSLGIIKETCNKIISLNAGKLEYFGDLKSWSMFDQLGVLC